MVNIINKGWHRALKALRVLLSWYLLLCGAVEILKIPSFGGFEGSVVSAPPAQGCQEGGFSGLVFFFFRCLN